MQLVFDFDGTVTQADTIGGLAQAAIKLQKHRHGLELEATWRQVVQDYLSDYQAYKASFEPAESARSNVDQELKFLAGLKGVEEASLARVASSGVFSRLERADLFQMGADSVRNGDVVVRGGFQELVALAEERGWGVSIVSVNWSGAFIQGVLRSHSAIRVVSNEISPDGTIRGPPFLGSQLTTAPDKTKALGHLAAETDEKMIYFGDSTTDMSCLLKGGVVISNDESSSLLQTFRRVGIDVPHVGNQQDGTISWARDFREVLQSSVLDRA